MRNRGFILISTIGVMLVFVITGATFLTRSVWQAQAGRRIESRTAALQLAEAGLNQAARNMRTDTTVDDIPTQTLASGTFAIDPSEPLGNQLHRVTARGLSAQEERRIEAVLRLIPESIFQFALFGNQGLNISGDAITDSYDSSLGPYNSTPGLGYNAGHNGDIGTNGSLPGDVLFAGLSVFVDGQVAVGYDVSDPYSVVGGYNPLFITGGTSPPSDTQDIIAQTSTFPMPTVTVPASVPCMDHVVTGSTTETLSPTGGVNGDGVYCFQILELKGGGTLTASGEVTVYITGELITQGNSTLGNASDPTLLMVLMTSTGAATLSTGTMTGTSGFYGALYGPQSTITISGTAEIFGSVIAQNIKVPGDVLIHYDEALGDSDRLTNTYRTVRMAWREL